MVPPDVILTNSSVIWLISHKIISNINSLCFYLFNKLLYKTTKFLKNYTISKIIQKNYGGTSPTFTPSDILTSNDLDSSASISISSDN